MIIKQISSADASRISEFYLKNADHLREWEPLREATYHSVDAWKERLKEQEEEQADGRSARFISYNPEGNEVVAVCSLTNIIRGPFLACYMGYAVSEDYQGKGLMGNLCDYVIRYAFTDLQLNRIMANYMPPNQRSEALLMRLGFAKEGLAKKYLEINGKWEDHVLTSLINPQNR